MIQVFFKRNNKKFFEQDEMENLYRLFREIEVPTVLVVSKMEDDGICLDLNFLNKLDNKFKKEMEVSKKRVDDLLKPYEHQIEYYQNLGKLEIPVNYRHYDTL